jgi:glycosyltransferase involved in cell wall biosynthesis
LCQSGLVSGAGRRTVFVDFSTLPPDGSSGGAARFTLRLLSALAARTDAHRYHILVKRRTVPVLAPLRGSAVEIEVLGDVVSEPRFLRRTVRRLPRRLSRFLSDPAALRLRGADVLFSPLFTALFHEPDLRHVAVAYDFQELSHPEFFNLSERARREAFRADLGRADRVVAISEATKKDAIERAGIPPVRVTVLPPVVGAPRTPLRPEEMEQRLAAQGLAAAGFTLYPANFWPHKNHERLLAAFALARTKLPDMCLVLCGALDAARERLLSSVEARGLVDAVRVFPYVSDGDVTALLQGARFLVFPSLYEGFGIPVLEAMALGTPAACSDLPALRELAGEDAVYFDPADETSIADALSLLWTSEETRRNLSVGGLARAARYAALDVAGAYHRLLAF